MNDDLEARKSLLRQKSELLDRSLTAFLAYTKNMDEIHKEISVLKEKDEMDNTAVKALRDTYKRLLVECSKEAHLIAELNHEYNIEQKEFDAYLAQRQSNPPELKPRQNDSVEGDKSYYFYLLAIFYARSLSY